MQATHRLRISLATLWLYGYPAELRDAEKGLQAAEQACRIAPKQPQYQLTLAMACFLISRSIKPRRY